MKFNKFAVAISALGVLVAACEDTGPKQGLGTLLGAGGGALLGSQLGHGRGTLVGVGAGALLGALIGSEVGKSLDKADRDHMALANQRALETLPPGQSLPWRNPESGNSGTVTPKNYYKTGDGDYCREFEQTITVGGQTQQGYGRACRQPDGTWKIQG